MSNDLTVIAQLITSTMEMLKATNGGQKRRNLRLAKKTLRQLTRQFKRKGFTEQETELLNKLQIAIIDKTINL